jgi:DNA topoisomerase-1
VVQTIDAVAKRLGNTRAICRQCYVHPAVLDAYLDSSLGAGPMTAPHSSTLVQGLSPEEAMVLAFLKQRIAQQAPQVRKAS